MSNFQKQKNNMLNYFWGDYLLEIELEFKKGILFVRLNGILNKQTLNNFKNEVTKLIKETGIRNIVFNMSNLQDIDLDGIEELYNNYKISKDNNGSTFVCGLGDTNKINKTINMSRLLKNVEKTRGELEAIKIINA